MPANLATELFMFAAIAAGALALLTAYEYRQMTYHKARADRAWSHAIRFPDEKVPVTIDREEARTLLRCIKIAIDAGVKDEFPDEFAADVFLQRMTSRFKKIADMPRIPAQP